SCFTYHASSHPVQNARLVRTSRASSIMVPVLASAGLTYALFYASCPVLLIQSCIATLRSLLRCFLRAGLFHLHLDQSLRPVCQLLPRHRHWLGLLHRPFDLPLRWPLLLVS